MPLSFMEGIWSKKFNHTKTAAPLLLLAACLVWGTAGGSRGSWRYNFQKELLTGAEEMYMPGMAYLNRSPGIGIQEWI